MRERHLYRVIESERLPPTVGAHEFHYSARFQMAALACACGCGHRVMLNLLDQHTVEFDNDLPTVCPSILVADAPCLSHFWITKGEVVWAEHWSKSTVDRVMAAQLDRHLKADAEQTSIWAKAWSWLKAVFLR
jgi:hypothetical protein